MGANLPIVDLGPLRTAKALAAGFGHTCALLDNNTVKCWGFNGTGQLGQGDTTIRGKNPADMGANLPAIDLGSERTAKAITAGYAHTCALLDDNTVKCWGFNGHGQLGRGDTSSRGDNPGEMGANLPPVDLGPGRTAKAIAAMGDRTCALLDNNAVKCWGSNGLGQLGLGDAVNRGDDPDEMGANLPPVDLGGGRTAKAITGGSIGHTCALLDNNTVKCWGLNDSGQLGLGDVKNRGSGPVDMGVNLPAIDLGSGRTATALTAGSSHTCAVLDDATLKCWGDNSEGQLGRGDVQDRGDGAAEMGDMLPAIVLR
jgi:alpha-tubulin suppressor-like RCC1 family protein